MKKINHNDLTHYFLRPHQELPRSYIDSCEKFFRELKNLKLARLTAENVQKKKIPETTANGGLKNKRAGSIPPALKQHERRKI